MPEADVAVGTLDQARDVRHGRAHEAGKLDHADHGGEGGEGIRGNLGRRIRERAEQGRFAGVGETHEPDVGDAAEFEVIPALVALRAFGELDRGLVCVGAETPVALAADAAATKQKPLAGGREVGDDLAGGRVVSVENVVFLHFAGIEIRVEGFFVQLVFEKFVLFRVRFAFRFRSFGAVDHRARRHLENEVIARAPRLFLSHPGRALFGVILMLIEKAPEVVGVGVDDEHDVASRATITPIGTTLGHEFLPPEARGTVSAVSGLGKNADVINKHGKIGLRGENPTTTTDSLLWETASAGEGDSF